ncbi:MAG: hypothetical protein AAF517_14240 [Planctomycetota bacterium]
MKLLVGFCLTIPFTLHAQAPWRLNPDGSTTIEAERPIQVIGRTGLEKRDVASKGEVLGKGWGSGAGHFAELFFRTPKTLKPARIRFRYARDLPETAWLHLILDSVPVGRVSFPSTGGDGSEASHYREVSVGIPQLRSGYHRLYLTVVADGVPSNPIPQTQLMPSSVLDLVGNRDDKNSVGHGKNVALYTGRGARKRYFYATHELGNIFSAADGETLDWYPDHVLLEGNTSNPAIDSQLYIDYVTFEELEGPVLTARRETKELVVEQRQVCVTPDDVVVSQIWIHNRTKKALTHKVEITGDCRKSFDWRERPGGKRETIRRGDRILMIDRSVFLRLSPTVCAWRSARASNPLPFKSTRQVSTPSRSPSTFKRESGDRS